MSWPTHQLGLTSGGCRGVSVAALHHQDRHFHTTHLRTQLKERLIRGTALSLLGQACKFVLLAGSTVLMARLLKPADFGLVAMVTAVTGLAAVFKDLGLSAATIQWPTITHQQTSTLFWVNLGAGAGLALVAAGLSPAIAWFYGEPRLMLITVALASSFLIGGLTVQHDALLRRQMRLGAVAVIEIVAMGAGAATSVALALGGAGYWALVAAVPVSTAVNAAMAWALCDWRPAMSGGGAGVGSLLVFGGNLSGYNVAAYLARNMDNVLIGWRCGAGPLGFYSKAYQLLMLPLSQISSPLYNVVVPALSRLQDDPDQYRRYATGVFNGIMWITCPAIALLAACSDEVALLALGAQWGQAGELFKILSLGAVSQPLHNLVPWLLISSGKTDRLLRWGIGSGAVLTAAFLVGIFWGARGVAIGYVCGFVLGGLPWTLCYGLRDCRVKRRELMGAAAAPLLAGVTVFAAAVAGHRMAHGQGPLVVMALSGAAAGIVLALLIGVSRRVRGELLLLGQAAGHVWRQAPRQRDTRRSSPSRSAIAIAHPLMDRGGSEAGVMWMIEALKDRGPITLLTTRPIKLDELNDCYGTTVKQSELDVRVARLPGMLKRRTDISALRGAVFQRYCRSVADEFDLLISGYNTCDFGRPAIHKIADFSWDQSLRRELDPDGLESARRIHRPGALRSIYLGAAELLERPSRRNLFDGQDLVVANSQWTAEILKSRYGARRCQVVYPPVPSRFTAVDFEAREPGFVCLGRVAPEKRVERIIDILGRVRKLGHPIHLHILGRIDDSAYGRLIHDLCEQNREWIFAEGHVHGQAKQRLLSGHRFGIHACRIEAFGIAVAEMVKAGCIPLVPDAGGQVEIVDHPMLCYHDVNDAAARIDHILRSIPLQDSLRRHLRNAAERFSPQRFMREFSGVVDAFIEGKAHA